MTPDLRVFVALLPLTPPALLRLWAALRNESVLSAIAGNPNTPGDVHRIILDEVRRNVLLRSDVILTNTARNPATPVEVIHRLGRWHARTVACHPAVDAAWLAEHVGAGYDTDIAQHPHTPATVLTHLADSPDIHVRVAVASNPQTPADVLRFLAANRRSQRLQAAVAANPATPMDLLADYATHTNSDYRAAVAANPAAPQNLLVALSGDAAAIKAHVAANPHTPATVLTQLAVDPDESVRQRVAANLATPRDVLQRLAVDVSHWVRRAVAANPHTPLSLLAGFADDPAPGVRDEVIVHPHVTADLLTRVWAHARHDPYPFAGYSNTPHLLTHPVAPAQVLHEVLDHPQATDQQRAIVSLHPNTDDATLTRLAADPHPVVRLCVAANPSLTGAAMTAATATSSTATWTVLTSDPDVVARGLAHPTASVRAAFLAHATLTAGQVATAAGDPSWQVRRVAATRLSDTDLLNQLSHDSSRAVRTAAGQRWLHLMADTSADTTALLVS